MKVLHVPYCYFPDPVGGTEIYVQALAREQQRMGFEVEIAAPAPDNCAYEHDGILVRRFGGSPNITLRQLYGEGDPTSAENFVNFALAGRPDLLHLHSFTASVSTKLVLAVKRLGVPVVFTYHTPTVTCSRGTLLHFGEKVCNGAVSTAKCSACNLHAHGLPGPVARTLAALPNGIAHLASPLLTTITPKFRTAIEMPELIELRIRAARTLFREVDHIVAVCEWIKSLLIANDVPEAKVTMARQGLPQVQQSMRNSSPLPPSPLRLAFLGRLSENKGIEMLADAVLRADANVTLDVYGVAQDAEGAAIQQRLKDLSLRSSRVQLLPPVKSGDVVGALTKYHMLAVPSQGLETGPLVVYEAFAAGLPVLGSNLGGIAEIVANGSDGILVRHDDLREWVLAIESLASNPRLVASLAANVTSPRTMAHVARDMAAVYHSVFAPVPVSVH